MLLLSLYYMCVIALLILDNKRYVEARICILIRGVCCAKPVEKLGGGVCQQQSFQDN